MNEWPALDITAIEDRIRQDIAAAKAQGISIRPYMQSIVTHHDGSLHVEGDVTCPLGAVALQTPRDMLVMDRLGVDDAWMKLFMRGFDRHPCQTAHPLPKWMAAYELGRKLRDEFDAGLLG